MYTDFHDQNGNPVSAETVLAAVKSPIIRHTCGFELWHRGAHTPFGYFTEDDYIRESLIITNSCGSDGIKLGSVNIGLLKVVVKNEKVSTFQSPNDLIDLVLDPDFRIQIDDNTRVGMMNCTYYVKEVEQLTEGVKLTCYDGMCFLDAPFSGALSGTPYQILTAAATACNTRVQSTQAEIEALPNGTKTFTLHEDNDCKTWRDVLSYLTALMGCFVTFGRRTRGSMDLPGIVVRPFGGGASSFCDTITDTQRYTGAKFSLWDTAYAEFTLKSYALKDPQDPDSKEKMDFTYSDATVSTEGQTYDLGYNPFLQPTTPESGLTADQTAILHDLLAKVATYQYTPLQITLPVGFIYDLGDVIKCTGRLANTGFAGGAVDDAYGVILNETYTYGRDYRIKSLDSHAGKGRIVVTPPVPPTPTTDYDCSTANTLLCRIINGSTNFEAYKSYDGLAYVAWIRNMGQNFGVGPLLVSKTENAVAFNNGVTTWTSLGTITFGGETYYYNYKGFVNDWSDSSGHLQKTEGVAKYIGQYSNVEDAAIFLLQLVNRTKTISSRFLCSTANELLCKIQGMWRKISYVKADGVAAYVAWFESPLGHLGPLLVSETESAVSYISEGTTYQSIGSITHGGNRWYYSNNDHFVDNLSSTQQYNEGGVAEFIGFNFATMEEAAEYLLTIVEGNA